MPADPPLLSVVVVIVSDTTDGRTDLAHLAGCLKALDAQVDPPAMEILVPHRAGLEGLDELSQRYPQVRFLDCADLKTWTGRGGSREHHDELRARGLAAARGQIVGLLEDHASPNSNWARAMVKAHQGPFAAVGGAIENGVDRALCWAVYFCDFGKYQNPVSAGPSAFASDANVCYKRASLDLIRLVWQDCFHETKVNSALVERGEMLALSPDAVVSQQRSDLRLGAAVRERFIWGRSFAATRVKGSGGRGRWGYAVLSPVLPAVLLLRMAGNVLKRGRHWWAFLRALPLTFLLVSSWSLGELVGYLTGKATLARAEPS